MGADVHCTFSPPIATSLTVSTGGHLMPFLAARIGEAKYNDSTSSNVYLTG